MRETGQSRTTSISPSTSVSNFSRRVPRVHSARNCYRLNVWRKVFIIGVEHTATTATLRTNIYQSRFYFRVFHSESLCRKRFDKVSARGVSRLCINVPAYTTLAKSATSECFDYISYARASRYNVWKCGFDSSSRHGCARLLGVSVTRRWTGRTDEGLLRTWYNSVLTRNAV